MSEAQKSTESTPQELINSMAFGYILSRVLHVVAELGIADLRSSGPKPGLRGFMGSYMKSRTR